MNCRIAPAIQRSIMGRYPILLVVLLLASTAALCQSAATAPQHEAATPQSATSPVSATSAPSPSLGETSPPSTAPQGSAAQGENLFTGKTRFANRGPACITCHSVAGVPFPNGGTLAPDLTDTYDRLGEHGTEAAMQTLYFPVMAAIYSQHPLNPQEQANLVAFFKQTSAEARPQAPNVTPILILLAFILAVIFVALSAFFWRKRVLSVRRALVARATGQGARS